MLNLSIGDAALEWRRSENEEGVNFEFHPSFFSMQRIGEPEDIKFVSDTVYSAANSYSLTGAISWREFNACVDVLQSCCDDDLPHEMTGYYTESGEFVQGAIDVHDLIVMAIHMLKFGIHGEPSKRMRALSRKDKPRDAVTLFNPVDFVTSAMAHLGISRDDAWNMTMIEFQKAMEAKFPPSEKERKKEASLMSREDLRELKQRVAQARARAKNGKQ